MKSQIKKIVLLLLLPLGSMAAGHGDGGGHPYEIRFKEVGNKAFVDLLKYKDEKLFDENMFDVYAYKNKLENGLVLCANDQELKVLNKMSKMMYYFSETDKVALDCTNKFDKEWTQMKEPSLNQKVLVVHEVLRNLGVKEEDVYGKSGKLYELNHLYEKIEIQKLSDSYRGLSDKCSISMYTSKVFEPGTNRWRPVKGELSISLQIRSEVEGSSKAIYSSQHKIRIKEKLETVKSRFLFQTTQDKPFYRDLRDHFVKEYKRLGCWE